MSKKEPLSRKLTFGIFYLFSSSIASLGINVITLSFIARALGVENFGLYSAIISFAGLFQFLTDFGLNKTLLKFGSTDIKKAQISFGNALLIKSILIIPFLIILLFFGFLSGYRDKDLFILFLFTVSLVSDSFGLVFSSIRRILGSFKVISFFRVVRNLINLIVILVALSIKNSVLSLALANTVLSLVVFLVSLISTISLLKPKLRLSLIKDFFKDSLIFSLSDFFLNLYARISTVLLSFFNDLHSVGIYSAALRFTRIANLLPNQVKIALLPTLYRILENERSESREQRAEKKDSLSPPAPEGRGSPNLVGRHLTVQHSRKVFTTLLKYMIIFATPVVISICFFSEPIIHLIFGKRYDLSIPLLRLFSLFIYLRFIETPFTLFYIGMHKNKTMLYFQGLTGFLNVILNLVLIPKFSFYGACASTLVSESVFALMVICLGVRYLIWNILNVILLLVKPTISGFLSIFVVGVMLESFSVIFQIILLFLIYTFLLFALKVFDKEDKELFSKIFTYKKEEVTGEADESRVVLDV